MISNKQKRDGIMSKMHRFLNLSVFNGLLTIFQRCAATQKRESTGQYVDYSVITTKAVQ